MTAQSIGAFITSIMVVVSAWFGTLKVPHFSLSMPLVPSIQLASSSPATVATSTRSQTATTSTETATTTNN